MEDEELYIAYFQKSANYYLNILQKFRNGYRFVFNPYALLAGLLWFLYRKLYKETIVIVFISVSLNIIENNVFLNPAIKPYSRQIALSVSILLNASYGIFANYLYIKKAIKQVEYAKTNFINKDDAQAYLYGKGGTTMHPVFILIILFLVSLILLSQFK